MELIKTMNQPLSKGNQRFVVHQPEVLFDNYASVIYIYML